MSKSSKLLVARGVDHWLISGAWRLLAISAVTAQEVRRLCAQAVGEIFCVRGSWSWKTGDELTYVQRVLREIGVDESDRRVVERQAKDVVFDYGDKLVVVTDEKEKVAFTLYVAHPWDVSLRPLRRKRRRAQKKAVWLGKLGD